MSDETSTKPVTKDADPEEVSVPTSAPASSAAVEVEESVLPVGEAVVEPSQTEQTAAVETAEPVEAVKPIANVAIKAEPLVTPEAGVDDEASADATSAPMPVAAAVEEEAPLVAVKEEEVATAVDEDEAAAAATCGDGIFQVEDPIAAIKIEEPTFTAEAEEPIATATKAAEVAEPTVKDEEAAVAVKEEEEAAVTAEESRPDAKQPTSPVKGSPKKHTTSSPVPVSTAAKPGAETARAAATAAGDTKLYLESSVIPVLRLGLRELVRVRPSDPLEFMSDYFKKASQNKS